MYVAGGVSEIWLISPKERTVERVVRQERAKASEVIVLPAPLTGKIALADIFRW